MSLSTYSIKISSPVISTLSLWVRSCSDFCWVLEDPFEVYWAPWFGPFCVEPVVDYIVPFAELADGLPEGFESLPLESD